MPDSAKLVVTAYVKQESHWAVQAMFSFWKERSRVWRNLKLWHCIYCVCLGPTDFIHQKQCLRINGWKPTDSFVYEGKWRHIAHCPHLPVAGLGDVWQEVSTDGLQGKECPQARCWYFWMACHATLHAGHELHLADLASDSDDVIFHDPQLDLKDPKAEPLNFKLKGPVIAVISWDLLSDSFSAFTENIFLKLF